MRKLLTYFAVLMLSCPCAVLAQDDNDAYLTAVSEYASGRYAEAKKVFEAMAARDSSDDAAYYYLGQCEFALNDFAGSEKHLSRAIQLDSTNEWYLHALATLYNSKGDRLKSAALCEKLVKMNPALYNNSFTLTLIGDAKLSTRQDSLALVYYNQALDIDPEYAPAEINKAEIMRMHGNYPAFFLSLSNVVRNPDVRADIKSEYLTNLMENIDSRFFWVWGTQINNLVNTCVKMSPDDITTNMLKLRMNYIYQDLDSVLVQCGIIERLSLERKDTANYVDACTIEGDVYHTRGDNKKTFDAYERALKYNPDKASILNNYAYYLCEQGKSLRKALKMSKKAITAEPDNATYLDTYGWILYLLKKPKEAKPYFKHAMIYGGKDSAVVLEHYSKVLEALGETELASYYKSLSEQKTGK